MIISDPTTSGFYVEIREASDGDADAVVEMFRVLDSETKFLLYEPGERDLSVAAHASRLCEIKESDRDLFLIAVVDSKVVGFCAGWGGHVQRNRHRLEIIIGIRQQSTGQGLGSRLLGEMESWARSNNFHRLELTVMVHNTRAISLYESLGFSSEGRRKNSLRVDGKFVDEHLMAKTI